ncbi:hypothetical protein [Ornithinibacillus bavariensis]|uniref:Uncharacterized protein n=1 Tax=Ornithinibacillus bavariensis TaxID=545502 RepID=A0A919X6B6_9BACI|nr:hypothetical protein [Ornithinibacillus bavariensis]GIO26341.1 hypothetical protein J43TS3_09520 [Ornithinibacillus bavariensis]
MKKLITNTNFAYLTTVFILIAVIYSFIVNEPIYKVTTFLFEATIIVSIITVAIHLNALKENKVKKKLILLSLVVPVTVIIYYVVGVIYWYNTGM